MRARVAKKLLKHALAQRLHVDTIVLGTMLVVSYDDSVTPDEMAQLATMLSRQSPCVQALALPDDHVKLAGVHAPGDVRP